MIGKGRREQGEGRIHSVWRYSPVLICRRRIARRSGRGGRTDQRLLGCTRLRNDTRNTRWSSGINAIAYRLQDRLVIELSRHLLFLVDPCSERKHRERRPTKAIDSDLYRALKSRTISISYVRVKTDTNESKCFFSNVRHARSIVKSLRKWSDKRRIIRSIRLEF